MKYHGEWRLLVLAALVMGFVAGAHQSATAADIGTPTPIGCAMAGTPAAGAHAHMADDMEMHDAAMPMDADLLFIDMMIPHHESIIALSQAALPRLQDERLQAIARAVIETQSAEIDELRGYRQAFYGSPDPEPLSDHAMMALMGDSSKPMDAMMAEMDADVQVAAFCASPDPDLAFIDLAIPHHESAVAASLVVLTSAVHPEIVDVAQRVIDAQQREIDELRQIREELVAAATPAARSS